MTVKNGYTHGGCFHADDVISTVFLKSLNPDITIFRLNEVSQDILSNDENIVFDIGGGKYDHHQQERLINDFGYPYSAFGLLWEDFGRELLEKKGFKKIEDAFEKFKVDVVSKIDQGDNCGYHNVIGFKENYTIKNFNANWYELKNNPSVQDEQFAKALEYTNLLFDNWMRKLYEQVEIQEQEKEIFINALVKSNNGIIVLPESIPWRDYVDEYAYRVKIVINKNIRGGYNVTSANEDSVKITQNEYLTFVHPSRFMGVANTLNDAVMAAKKILNY